MKTLREFCAAVQFLTRLPVPSFAFESGMVLSGAKFYPAVGALVALGAIGIERVSRTHLSAAIMALLVLGYLVLITGGFHEDGLADTADALGGGWTRERMLEIMHDSRIGSYGSIALVISLLARWLLLSSLQPARFASYVLAAHVLCRWTTLPLGVLAGSARREGMGAQLAHKISAASLVIGSVLAFLIAGYALRSEVWLPIAAVAAVTTITGSYYRSQIGGVTGDCFGATNQIAEIAVYLCAVWK
jgi:adenosylcobinamide-GDP ribazoletransferase